jgi:hypothetical protein
VLQLSFLVATKFDALLVNGLQSGVHHESKNFEMVRLLADSASSRASMVKLCPTVPNRWLLFNASSKMLEYQLLQ